MVHRVLDLCCKCDGYLVVTEVCFNLTEILQDRRGKKQGNSEQNIER